MNKPEILAPAGDIQSFLAAMSAGADAIYVGLKHFSARMQADNFSTTELAKMVELANANDRKIYIAFNTLIKQNDLGAAARLVKRLVRDVQPHALIIQEPGMIDLAQQAGYTGEIYLSTLANLTHHRAMQCAKEMGARRVILPRELSIDEIKDLDAKCPEGLDFEVFIHGALCYCVSGRCYWSSYMGGKSGLRGRCVQPCRRVYKQNNNSGRFFSCLDLSLDVLVKTLLEMQHVVSWKIEGRKKGPHYVYHVVTAYKMLRDHHQDPQARKDAEKLLHMALGRQTTRSRFLPQRQMAPTSSDSQTNSGLLVGKVKLDSEGILFKPYIELLPKDYLRIGYEDENWHATQSVTRRIPKAGSLSLRLAKHKTPKNGTPIFLIDRREPELIKILAEWQAKLNACKGQETKAVEFEAKLPRAVPSKKLPNIVVRSTLPQGIETRRNKSYLLGIWFSPKAVREVSKTVTPHMSWWLPPVIWPDEEESIERALIEALRNGAKHFVCNAPWQVRLFRDIVRDRYVEFIAGPFCNVTNALTIATLANLGFRAAFVSPELSKDEFFSLPKQSCLPLGMVISGYWPMGIARHEPLNLKNNMPWESPKGEVFWNRKYGQNTWIYPGWPLDLTEHQDELANAGYSFFAKMEEHPPHSLTPTTRPGLFNWNGEML